MGLLRSCALSLCLLSVAHAKSPESIIAIECEAKLECATQSVVSLLPDWPKNFTRNEEPEGSGIVLADGTIIATADHVLGPAKTARIRTLSGQVFAAEILVRDPLTDIALLRIPKKLRPFELSFDVDLAAKACAVGNSFGLDISLTCGVISAKEVSGVGFNRIEDFLQTDASVNPGMSGGALIDASGKLTGMLSAIFTRQSDANIGVNFAVSANLLTRVLNDYLDDEILSHSRPGLLLSPAKLDESDGFLGLEVKRIANQSAEEKAGFQIGDVLLKAGSRRLKRGGSYAAAVALINKGGVLEVSVLRRGKPVILKVKF